jgi:hypothetical protein
MTMTKTENVIGTILAAAALAVAVFVAGRQSTTLWPIGGESIEHACGQYMKARAAFVQAEREFEAKHSPYRYPVHAAVYRAFEPPNAYLARVSTDAHHAAYVRHRDDCARHMAAMRR